jgi:hypothetical protein
MINKTHKIVSVEGLSGSGEKNQAGWILTKPGTYLVLKGIWNPIDFQGHRSKVKVMFA